jgi:hypothetical protein
VTLRIECPQCGELVEVEEFLCARAPDRVRFECPDCEEEVTITSAGDPDMAEETVGEDLDDSGERLASARSSVAAPDRDGGVTDVVLQQLWELVVDDFDEGARHDAFIAASEAQNKLAFAAARYREWLADHPDDEVADGRQKQLLALAQVRALALSSRQSKEKDPLRKALTAFLVMVGLLVLVIVAAPILLRGARGCRAKGPDPAQLRPPTLPMVNNLRRRGSRRQGNRGLTPRRHRRRGRQLRNLKPRTSPRSPGVGTGVARPVVAPRPAPARPAPARPAPARPAPIRAVPAPLHDTR